MLYFFTFISLFIADLLTIKYPFFGKIGTILWIVSWIFIFSFAIKQLIELVKLAWSKKLFMTLIVVLLLGGIVLVNTTNPKNISGETTQEINCILTQFELSTDWGFNKTCLFGYPARQFIIPALPSLVFGRSLFALNFGGAIYFIIGLIIFASGLFSYLGKDKTSDIIIATILSFIFHIYYFNHLMFFYEQSIYPFCFTLIISGLFVYYLTEKSLKTLLLIGLSSFYLIFSYTSGLAVFFLVALTLFFILLGKKTKFLHRIVLTGVIFVLLLSYLLSLKFRGDINLVQITEPTVNLKNDLFNTFDHLLFQKHGNPIVSPIFNYIFLSTTILSIFFVFGWKMFIGSLWILVVIILSIISKGYVYYGIDYRLNRVTIVFPVLFIMIISIIKPYLKRIEHLNKLLIVFLLFMIITGVLFQKQYLTNKQPSDHLKIIKQLSLKFSADKSYKFYFDSNLSTNYISLNDQLQYFFPKAKSYILNPDCSNLDLSMNKENYFFISESNNNCLINGNNRLKFLYNLSLSSNQQRNLYKIIY